MRKMQFRVTGRPVLAAAILVASAGAAQAGTHTWRGGSGDSWHQASNWSPAGVPGAGDTARVASGVVSLGSSATVGSLWVGPEAEVKSAGRLTVLGTAVSQGLVTGAGTVRVPRGATARFSVAGGAVAAFRQRAGLSRAHAVALSGIENFGQASVEAAPGVRLGTVRNHAQLEIRVAGGASFTRVSNAGSLVVRGKGKRSVARGQSIRNLGRLSLEGAHVEAAAGVVNERGAEVVLEGAGVVEAPAGTAPVFENHGLVVKSGAGVAEVELEWENTGQLRVEGGTLLLNEVGGAEPTQEAGRTTLDGGALAVEGPGGARGTFVLDGGSLDGSGVINGNIVQNGGAVNVGFSPGMFTINGNYIQNADGILNMEIGGAAMGTGYDNLTVNGQGQFYGTLATKAWGTYIPPIGASFAILRFYSARLAWRATSLQTPVAHYGLSATSSSLAARCSWNTTGVRAY